jgi:hypothetical protein
MRETWCEQTYTSCISSRCWGWTPYDEGWDRSRVTGTPIELDDELREIVEMELDIDGVPDWAAKAVEGAIRNVGPCGHYTFPLSFLDAVDAIGRETPSRLIHTCYTVGRVRKLRMMDYALCLDAWLAGASPDIPAREIAARGSAPINWERVCFDLWDVLGERSDLKEALVERMLTELRHGIKSMVWDDDDGLVYCRDEYLGDFRESTSLARDNGNPQLIAPGWDLSSSPRVRRLEERIAILTPHAKWFLTVIGEFSWPCAPKAFRYLEKALWCIGKGRPVIDLPSFPLPDPEPVPGFLQCEDTWPDGERAAVWWREFLEALTCWWQDLQASGDVAEDVANRLGDSTPVKRWLVRLLTHRLRMLERYDGILCRLLHPPLAARKGMGPLGAIP